MLGLRALRREARSCAPDREEGLLHGVLGQTVVAHDAAREPVGDAPDPVVELCERGLVAARDERHEGFVREVGAVLAHRPGAGRVGR